MLSKRFVVRLPKVIERVFSPLLVPFYVALAMLFGDTSFAYFSLAVKWKLLFVVYCCTAILPLIVILGMKWIKVIPSCRFDDRQNRVAPLLVMAICYLMTMMYVVEGMGVAILTRLFLTMSVLVSVLTAITFFWKISIHTAFASSMSAFIYMILFIGLGNLQWIFFLSVLICGLVAASRLYLGVNNLCQIVAGGIVGALVAFFTLLL